MALSSSPSPQLFQLNVGVGRLPKDVTLACASLPVANWSSCLQRSLICCRSSSRTDGRFLVKPVSAVGSGLEASITDPKESLVSIKNVEIVVESEDEDKMQVRVEVPGKETLIVFDKVLRSLARSAPPVPGFRREKGGKTSKVYSLVSGYGVSSDTKPDEVPKEFLLQILGENRVTNFVIQEIVSSTLADYAEKENLTVKDNKVNTIQTAEELKAAFVPGNDFGFNATLELQKSKEAEVVEVESV